MTSKRKLYAKEVYDYHNKMKVKSSDEKKLYTYLLDRSPWVKAKGKGGMKGNQWNGRIRKDKLIKERFYKELCLSNPSTDSFHRFMKSHP